MADNVVLPGTGEKIAAKDIGGREFQEIIITDPKGNDINPATEETIILLRRMLKALESLSITDTAQRQRVVIDTFPANQSVNTAQIGGVAPLMNLGLSGTGSQRVTIASDSLMDEKTMMMREAYNNGIRRNLIFN